jgi:hypothetical protein
MLRSVSTLMRLFSQGTVNCCVQIDQVFFGMEVALAFHFS